MPGFAQMAVSHLDLNYGIAGSRRLTVAPQHGIQKFRRAGKEDDFIPQVQGLRVQAGDGRVRLRVQAPGNAVVQELDNRLGLRNQTAVVGGTVPDRLVPGIRRNAERVRDLSIALRRVAIHSGRRGRRSARHVVVASGDLEIANLSAPLGGGPQALPTGRPKATSCHAAKSNISSGSRSRRPPKPCKMGTTSASLWRPSSAIIRTRRERPASRRITCQLPRVGVPSISRPPFSPQSVFSGLVAPRKLANHQPAHSVGDEAYFAILAGEFFSDRALQHSGRFGYRAAPVVWHRHGVMAQAQRVEQLLVRFVEQAGP